MAQLSVVVSIPGRSEETAARIINPSRTVFRKPRRIFIGRGSGMKEFYFSSIGNSQTQAFAIAEILAETGMLVHLDAHCLPFLHH